MRLVLFVIFALSTTMAFAKEKATGSIALFKFIQEGESQDSSGSFSSSKTNTDYQYIDIGFCYTMGSICIGAKYLDASITTTSTYTFSGSSTSFEGTSETKFGGLGLKIGLSGDAYIAHYTYFAQPSLTTGSASGTSSDAQRTFVVGGANSIDLGYGFKVKKLRVGPMLSIINFDVTGYKDASGAEVDSETSFAYTVPYFALWIDF